MKSQRTTPPPPADDVVDWFAGRLPSEWFVAAPEITVDRDEILVLGELPTVEENQASAAHEGRISRWREQTRAERMRIADDAQNRYHRTVSWGARIGDTALLFTHLSVPVMTRLRQPQRQVLDTLVEAGVARSRSDALAWTVTLVGRHADEWLSELREALQAVDTLRAKGPGL